MIGLDNINRNTSPINDEGSLEAFSLRNAFLEWLYAGNAKKISSTVCISCLDKVSEYSVQKKICSLSFWDITNHSVFQQIYNRLLETKLLRVNEKNTYKDFIVAGQLYLRFLKDKLWLKSFIEKSYSETVGNFIEDDAFIVDSGRTPNNSETIIDFYTNINPHDFVNWLITQKNSRGTLYLERVALKYSQYLRSAPSKLNIPLTVDKRDVYTVRTIEEFDRLLEIFLAAPNFKQVNEYGHQTFSAGLKAYRRYLENLTSQEENVKERQKLDMEQTSVAGVEEFNNNVCYVDFSNTAACSGSDPVSCSIDNVNIDVIGNWRDLLVSVTEYCIMKFPGKMENLKTEWFSNYGNTPFLLLSKPILSGRKLSNGYWICVHYSISQLVLIISGVCRYCGINLDNVEITYTQKLNIKGYDVEEERNYDSSIFVQKKVRSAFKEWLSVLNSDWSESTLNMICSDSLYLYNNYRGITFSEAILADAGEQRAFEAIEQYFTVNPRQTGTAATAARGYIDTLRLFKQFLEEKMPELLKGGKCAFKDTIPELVVNILREEYASGFRFDTTMIRLLSEKSRVKVGDELQSALKHIMFRRNDDIYFFPDTVANAEIQKEIIDFANNWLDDYGCFEITELYEIFSDRINNKCIDSVESFENFYEFINKRNIRCVGCYGTRLVRIQGKSIKDLSINIVSKVVSIVCTEYSGTIDEDDLKDLFPAFSLSLIANIIREHAGELIKTEINGIICYQTLDAIGLSEDFSETLEEVLEQIDDLGLTPSEDVLHTVLSLKLGVNFKNEYNIPDDQTYRRLINSYYKNAPKRKWLKGIFMEVQE